MRSLAGPGSTAVPGGTSQHTAALPLALAAALALACAAAVLALCARGAGRRQRNPDVLQGNGSPMRVARPSKTVEDTTGKSLGPGSTTQHTGVPDFETSSTLQTAPAESAAIFTLPSTCAPPPPAARRRRLLYMARPRAARTLRRARLRVRRRRSQHARLLACATHPPHRAQHDANASC